MNTVMIVPAVAPPLYPQRHRVCRLHNVSSRPTQSIAQARMAARKDNTCSPVLTLLSLPDKIGRPAYVASERTELAMMHQAEALERLICEAETALASQSVRTYRQWYSHWRRRGVWVNDLLDMTWMWRQRARTD